MNDSKSVTGGSCVFYAAFFVLFVIICCQMFYVDHVCFLYVIDSNSGTGGSFVFDAALFMCFI